MALVVGVMSRRVCSVEILATSSAVLCDRQESQDCCSMACFLRWIGRYVRVYPTMVFAECTIGKCPEAAGYGAGG